MLETRTLIAPNPFTSNNLSANLTTAVCDWL